MKLLDTDHWVALLRGRLSLEGKVSPDESLAITAISVAELTHGASKSARAEENLARLDILLATLIILPFDEAAARHFGALKATLERSGNRLADLDLQIASIALANDLSLITHNTRHFARIPGLQLDDWLVD
jgi:tRNA(fMet)-specific endonuclease VapC